MIISQSRIKTWRRCRRKHHYKHNEDLAKKVRAKPLLRGTILHEMLEAFETDGKDPYVVLRRFEKRWKQIVRENPEEYGETFFDDIDRIFEGYRRAYASDPYKPLYLEEKGCVELPNGIEFHFIVDKIGVDKNGRRWLIDRKSHKNIPEERDRFSDIQLVLYYWAWNLTHPKEAVDGIVWDYLRTKPPAIPETLVKGGLTRRKNIDTDWHTYMTEIRRHQLDPRLYKEILDRLKARGSRDFFQRVPLPSPSKELVLSIVADTAATAAEIIKLGKTDKTRNLTRDCSWCEFYALCHAELRGLDGDFVRKTQYEVKDPDERYQDKEEE